MPQFMVTSPDGQKFKITAPDGSSQDQILAYAKQQFASMAQKNQPAAEPQQEPDNALVSGLKGAAEGFGRTVLGGQQLVGKGLEAAGAKGLGVWLENDARQGIDKLKREIAADRQAHPYATGVGEILGGAALPGGAAAKSVGAARPILQGALSGGLSGLLDPVEKAGDYWIEKAKQAGIGTAAGAAFGRLGRLIGSPTQKGVQPAAKKLLDAGVPLTPGQMIGGMAKGIEEKATAVPLTGYMVQSAFNRATEGWNIATINKALANIGAQLPKDIPAGHKAVKAAQQKISSTYDQVLSRMSLAADKQLQSGILDVIDQAKNGAVSASHLGELQRYFDQRIKTVFQKAGGVLNGNQAKAFESDLRAEEAAWRRAVSFDPRNKDYADAISSIHQIVDDALSRQNPNFASAKNATDKAYAMMYRINQAAGNRRAGRGVFTPSDLLGAIKSQDTTVKKNAFAAGDGFMQDWAEDADDVIGNHTPDSGTTGRMLAAHAFGAGAGLARPDLLVAAAAGSLPYTKLGGAAVRTAGPPVARAVGKALPYAGAAVGPMIGGGQ